MVNVNALFTSEAKFSVMRNGQSINNILVELENGSCQVKMKSQE